VRWRKDGREHLLACDWVAGCDGHHGISRASIPASVLRTFERLGLRSIPMLADTGPIGGNLSHEFIVLASTGESEVFCHKDFLSYPVPGPDTDFDDVAGVQGIVDRWTSIYAATSEMHDEAAYHAIPEASRVSARGIEVGHIFYFGTKYSEPMGATVAGPDGKDTHVHMGSYGIGPTRLIAALIEAGHDEAGIIWPDEIAPFSVSLLNLKMGDAGTDAACETLYAGLLAAGVDVLYDDRDERPAVKFKDADLIGVPLRLTLGDRGLKEGKVEVKWRTQKEATLIALDGAPDAVAAMVREALKPKG
jgi:prolyl-tRNA synthetase